MATLHGDHVSLHGHWVSLYGNIDQKKKRARTEPCGTPGITGAYSPAHRCVPWV